jgi:hypothetical protein
MKTLLFLLSISFVAQAFNDYPDPNPLSGLYGDGGIICSDSTPIGDSINVVSLQTYEVYNSTTKKYVPGSKTTKHYDSCGRM